MDTCPHCGAPGSPEDFGGGRCPVCGMALSAAGEGAKATVEPLDVAPAGAQPPASTLRPAELSSREASTIALPDGGPDEGGDGDGDDFPQGEELIKPREFSPEYARRMTAAWQQTRSQFKDPHETIKSESGGLAELRGLNVGARKVGPVEDPSLKDYELTEVIGEGAMGTVWSARQTSLDRNVAVKIPKGAATNTDLGQRQFMSEVVVTGQLDHPNIVPIYDLAKDASGKLFYSMKRVEGRPWSDLLEAKELTLQENIEVLMKVCDAIRFAHDRGVIHRDIKPHNVMVGSYGEVSMMDWGIALHLDQQSGLTSVSRLSPAGTPAYMAPEMATGAAGDIGYATDVYLLGAILYEVLTGEPPHPPPTDSKSHAELVGKALMIAASNEIKPIGARGELVDVAYRALATDVVHRYQTVDAFQDAIRSYLSHAESITLTERGEELLQRARANGQATGRHGGRFDDFDRARFAFGEALEIWPGNRTARARLDETLLAYAGYAYDEGAYARGIALLNEENPAHNDLLRKLKKARRRTDSLSMLLRVAAAVIVIGGAAFTFFLHRARGEAERQRDLANEARVAAERNEARAIEQEALAKVSERRALEQEELAKANETRALEQEELAKSNETRALEQEELAKSNETRALEQEGIAKANAARAQRSSYVSEIGLAAEEIDRNAFDRTEEILDAQEASETKNELRNWEWGYLQSLVNLARQTGPYQGRELPGRVEATAVSGNRAWAAAGTTSGDVYVWALDGADEQPVRLRYGDAVYDLAITADGATLFAAGRSGDGRHSVKAWSLPARDEAAPLRELLTHEAPILSLDLSPDSSTVLASTADGWVMTAPVDGSRQPTKFPATSQVNSIWSARFSPDSRWIVTAGEDHTVRVWPATVRSTEPGDPVREVGRFEGHAEPVYTAAFSPDGRWVVSGGRDRRVLATRFDADETGQARYSPTSTVRRRLSGASTEAETTGSMLLGEHDAAVRSIDFSTDGATLFTAGNDNTVRVWDVAEGLNDAAPLKTLRGHGGWVRSCVALPDEPGVVLSGGYDRRVQVWNWREYDFPRVLRHESRRGLGDPRLTTGAASPDGQWVATASASGVVTLWDMADRSRAPQELAEGHDWQATTGVYFADGRRLLTAGGDNAALVWDERRGNELVRMGGWNARVGAGWRGVAAVSRDARWVVTGADGDILVRVWRADTGELAASIRAPAAGAWPEGERPEATAVAFSPGGDSIVITDQWGTCYIARSAQQWRLRSFQAHDGKISAVAFLPDGQGFLTASFDGTVQEWRLTPDGQTAGAMYRHADRVVAMDLSADGATIVTGAGSEDNEAVLRVWDRARPEAPTHSLGLGDIGGVRTSPEDKDWMVRSVSVHPQDQRALVTVFDPQTSTYRVGAWDWNERARPYRLVTRRGLQDVSTAVFAPHRGDAILTVGGRGARLQALDAAALQEPMTYRPQAAIRSVGFSPDSQRLLSASADGTLKLWALDPETRQWRPERKVVGGHEEAINSVVFHPTRSDRFLTASDDGTAKLWRESDGAWEPVQTFATPGGEGGAVCDAEFLPGAGDDLRVVTAGDGGAYLWDDARAAPRAVNGGEAACCVAPSPDGEWFVVASGAAARVYRADSLQPTASALSGHSAEITALAFTPDGSRLFTTSRDDSVKVWDTQTLIANPERTDQQREILTLEGHSDEVTSVTVATAPDRSFVVTTGLDGQAIIWPGAAPAP